VNDVALIAFPIVAILFLAGNIKIGYLLYKLGFNFVVMKFFLLESLFIGVSATILYSYSFSAGSFVMVSIILCCIIPAIYTSTTKIVNPSLRKTKPHYMSQQEWNWRDYDIGQHTNHGNDFGSY